MAGHQKCNELRSCVTIGSNLLERESFFSDRVIMVATQQRTAVSLNLVTNPTWPLPVVHFGSVNGRSAARQWRRQRGRGGRQNCPSCSRKKSVHLDGLCLDAAGDQTVVDEGGTPVGFVSVDVLEPCCANFEVIQNAWIFLWVAPAAAFPERKCRLATSNVHPAVGR